MNASALKRIPIRIDGLEYQISVDADEAAAREVAAYVDSRILEIKNSRVTSDSTKAAILAALNIAGELFETRQKNAALEDDLASAGRAVARISERIAAID